MGKCLLFDRQDGVIGIGFEIEYGGIKQYSICWPDRPPERMNADYLVLNKIKLAGEADVIKTVDALPAPPLVDVPNHVVTAPIASDATVPPTTETHGENQTLPSDPSQGESQNPPSDSNTPPQG